MCGRYSLTTAPEAMRRLFEFAGLPNLGPRYNIAPTQAAPVVRKTADGRRLDLLRWGLIPPWAKDRSIASRLINARAETVAEKPAFRAAFRHRRCLVPADGFYEWRTEQGRKQPFRIGLKGGGPFAFAGLWESWTAPEGRGEDADAHLETFTILTTEANEKLRAIHPRMPVILPGAAYEPWLDAAATPPEAALAWLCPYPAEPMAFYRVSTRVNNVRNDDPDCIAPLERAPEA